MSAITPRALALLVSAEANDEMIYVHYKDTTGYRFEGRILEVDDQFFDMEATDGEVVNNCMVGRILLIDVRPYQRFSGYNAADFVADFGPGVSG